MRDGGWVSADVYRPRAADRHPTLLVSSGYPKKLDHLPSNPAYRFLETSDFEWWVAHGYAIVRTDARGHLVIPLRPGDTTDDPLLPLDAGGVWGGAAWRSGVRMVQALEVPTRFASFDDFWQPFLGGQGPAPGYVASLNEAQRHELRSSLGRRLPRAPDGAIPLVARAWAVRGEG